MTDDLPTQFVQNLQQVRIASQRIIEMSAALDHIDDDLRRTGNLAASNLETLKTVAERTLVSLDGLLTTDGLFNQMSASTYSTIAALNDATTNLVAGVSRLESSTRQLPQIGISFDQQLRTFDELLTQLRFLDESMTQQDSSTEEANAVPLSIRISLVAPSAIVAAAIASLVTNSSATAAMLSSAIVFAGVVGGTSWSRVQKFLRVLASAAKSSMRN